MDIILATNSVDPFLALESIGLYAYGSSGRCNLVVRSNWTKASRVFFFETMDEFIADLRQLQITLQGAATLKLMREDPFLRFTGNGRGGIRVSGLLIDDPGDQRLYFAFDTDQTCLPALIADLTAIPFLP